MLRIWLTALMIAAALVVVADFHLLQRSGLLSYCATTRTPAGTSGYWRACHRGWLTGRPDLSRDSCKREGITGKLEYWRCPAPLAAGRAD